MLYGLIFKLFYKTVSICPISIINLNVLLKSYQNMPFYAVAKGRTTGIFTTWADCEAQVKGFSGAKYKKFDSVVNAQEFLSPDSSTTNKKNYQNNNTASNVNLKRTYSVTSSHNRKSDNSSNSNPSSSSANPGVQDDGDDSLYSDDLDIILNKQMDDIEKRLKSFEKNVDRICKKSSKSRNTILIEPPEPKKVRKKDPNEYEKDSEGYVQVYTDGACSANGSSGAKAGIGVFWGKEHPQNMSEPVSGRATNNCGEIQAAIRAIQQALENGIKKLTINTDSKFLINSVTKWIPGWKRKGWKLASGEPVKNEKDFKVLDSIQNKLVIKWNYVEAHRGIVGNEMADKLAKAGAALYNKK